MFVQHVKSAVPKPRKVVIVGNSEVSYRAAHAFSRPGSGFEFLGFFDDEQSVRNGFPWLGTLNQCVEFAVRNQVDTIYSTILPVANREIQSILSAGSKQKIAVKFLPDIRLEWGRPLVLSKEGELPVILVRPEPLENIFNRAAKRLFDIAFSLFVLVFILSWLLPLLGLLIRLDSKGPVFFRQQRSGRKDNVFGCYKFRSMHLNRHSDQLFTQPNDQRITRVGKWLRKSNLDELPQFINVLLGDMSVVGPRPHMVMHTQQYAPLIKQYMVRQYVKPGITGLAQIRGYRGAMSIALMEARVKLDIWYIEHWTFWLDIKLIMKTCIKMFLWDRNAY